MFSNNIFEDNIIKKRDRYIITFINKNNDSKFVVVIRKINKYAMRFSLFSEFEKFVL